MYSDKSDKENDQEHDESDNEVMGKSEESDTDTSERQDDSYIEPEPVEPLKETTYTEQSHEELGEVKVRFSESFGFLILGNFLMKLNISFVCHITYFPNREYLCDTYFLLKVACM